MPLTPILETAYEILKPAGFKCKDIKAIAEKTTKLNKNMHFTMEEFSKRLQHALANNLRLKRQKPSFVSELLFQARTFIYLSVG